MPDARWATPVVGQLTRCEGGGLATLHAEGLSRLKEFEIVNLESLGELINCHHSWVPNAYLQAAYVLLAETREVGQLFLSKLPL